MVRNIDELAIGSTQTMHYQRETYDTTLSEIKDHHISHNLLSIRIQNTIQEEE